MIGVSRLITLRATVVSGFHPRTFTRGKNFPCCCERWLASNPRSFPLHLTPIPPRKSESNFAATVFPLRHTHSFFSCPLSLLSFPPFGGLKQNNRTKDVLSRLTGCWTRNSQTPRNEGLILAIALLIRKDAKMRYNPHNGAKMHAKVQNPSGI